MSMFRYDESCTKRALRPRHPVVCFLDTMGIVITLSFLSQSNHVVVQSYLLAIALLYVFSGLHHWLSYADWSRRLDHIMIFVVISMTAMPYWGSFMPLPWAPAGYIIIAAIIILGVVAKLISYFPKEVSAVLYSAAGLPMVGHFLCKWSEVPTPFNLLWMVGVGLYFLQMIIYTFHWFDFRKEQFGFREMQHLFLLSATTLHSYIALQLVG